MTGLSLFCFERTFSSGGDLGLLTSVASLVAEHGLCGASASAVVAHKLSHSEYVGSSWTRDQIHVPHIGKWTPNNGTTKEVLGKIFILWLDKFLCPVGHKQGNCSFSCCWKPSSYYEESNWRRFNPFY